MNSTYSIKLQLSLILIIILSILGCERQVVEIMVPDDNRHISDLPINSIEIIHQHELAPFPVIVRVDGEFPNPCDYKHNETKVIISEDREKSLLTSAWNGYQASPGFTA